MVDSNLEKILNKKYRLLSQLGEGAMGIVYRADQLDVEGRPQRQVALKTLLPHLSTNLDFSRRFSREVHVAMQLHTPHTVTVYDSGKDEDGQLYFTMELMSGQTLREVLQQHRKFSVERAVRIASQICAALAEAHSLPEPVVHRDLKPANIFVEQQLDQDWIKVADFGIAKILGEQAAPLTTTGIIGTPRYMAPEQWRGDEVDPRTDLYALGVVLYEMVSGRAPFLGAPAVLMQKHLSEPPPPLPSTLPASLCSLIMRLLAKEPANRPRTALTVRQELARSLGEHQKESPSRQAESQENGQEETQPTLPAPRPFSPSEDKKRNNNIPSNDTPSPEDKSTPPESKVVKVWRNKNRLLIGVILLVVGAGGFMWRSHWAPGEPLAVLLEAAERGDVVAQFNLGGIYAKGKDVTQDFQEAARWYTKAAEQDYANAQANLCVLYAQGKGNPQNFHEAAGWCQKAAEKGNAFAQANLGTLYAQGRDVPRDLAKAEWWWRQAAEQDLAEAQYYLGDLYEHGRVGESPNYTEASKWYRKAADQGFAPAQRNLGKLYARGLGVPKNPTEAIRWYRAAAEKGDTDAQEQLKKLLGTNAATP